jgi:hypothetical protein
LVGVEDRRAKNGRTLFGTRRGVHHIIGADDECYVGRLEFLVDVVELEDEIIGNAGFSEQHVHLTWHTAGDRMDRELDGDPCCLQESYKLVEFLLSLRGRAALDLSNA